MSTKRKRLSRRVGVETFAASIPTLTKAFQQAGLASAVRLSYKSDEPAAVLALERFAIPERPHFLLQGEVVDVRTIESRFTHVGAESTANFEHEWGSWLLTLARDREGLRSLNLSHIVRPGAVRLDYLGQHLAPIVENAGANQVREGCLRLESGVRLELWMGAVERLQLKETVPAHILVDELTALIFRHLAESERLLGSMKSWFPDFRSLLDTNAIVSSSDLRPWMGLELVVSDWRSNVDRQVLSELAEKIEADTGISTGVLEVVILEGRGESPSPLVALHFGWTSGGIEVYWVPLSRNSVQLKKAWAIVDRLGQF
jgi:hypothetical protein